MLLEAKTNIKKINLADASLKLDIKYNKNIGYHVIAKKGLIPFMRLHKLNDKFFKKPEVNPLFKMILKDSINASYQNEEKNEEILIPVK